MGIYHYGHFLLYTHKIYIYSIIVLITIVSVIVGLRKNWKGGGGVLKYHTTEQWHKLRKLMKIKISQETKAKKLPRIIYEFCLSEINPHYLTYYL